MSGPGFGERLRAAVRDHGHVVVGIDPHPTLLEAWGLPDTPDGLRTFSQTVLEAVAEDACAVKPQSAFFERHGSAGIAVLEEVLAEARRRGVLTILDVKRGDIGSTMDAYVESFLRPGAPTEADAITVSPYLGRAVVDPALPYLAEHGKGLFVLCLTSNPEGAAVQHAGTAGSAGSVAGRVASYAAEVNASVLADAPSDAWGPVGLVVGATVGSAPRDLGLALDEVRGPMLSPGIGAQGAGPDDLVEVFGSARPQVLASVSRAVLQAGPDVDDLRRETRNVRFSTQDALTS
jgi:orotidine-5'-phosphate decarboxylase